MKNGQKSCDRCGERGHYFVTPYWDPETGLCSQCCLELNRLHDEQGWPAGSPSDELEPLGDHRVLRAGPTLSSAPVPEPRSA